MYMTTDDGVRIAYRVDGPEAAPVLLLSNSLGTTMEMWAPQVRRLAEQYRVVRYDSRGHGGSDVPAGDYAMSRLGLDALALLDHLKVQRARFCGLSKGGMVGMWLATHAPARIERLALCNTAAYMGPPASWQQRIDSVRADGMTAVVDAVVDRWFTPAFRQSSPEHVAQIQAMLMAASPVGYTGCCAAIRDMDQRDAIRAIHAPTLVIGGTADPATPPEKAQEIAQAIADSHLVMLEAAHLSNIEQPGRFTAALIDFMEPQ